MNKHLKNLFVKKQGVQEAMVSGIKCNRCQRIQPTMPESVFLNPDYKCECEKQTINEPDFLVLTPTQDEIKELDQILIKELKKRGRPAKFTSDEERKVFEKEYNKKYYEEKRQKTRTVCDICYGHYINGHKIPHENTKKHKLVVSLLSKK